MTIARTPIDKLAAVKKAYFAEILPGIRTMYERTGMAREAFLLLHCSILSVSGFHSGSRDTNGASYRSFVDSYFPSAYTSKELWKDLRNSLVHGYTLPQTFILAHRHPERHLHVFSGIVSERTGHPADLLCLNLEDFLSDTVAACEAYFDAVAADTVLLAKLCARFEIAPPAVYVPDRDLG